MTKIKKTDILSPKRLSSLYLYFTRHQTFCQDKTPVRAVRGDANGVWGQSPHYFFAYFLILLIPTPIDKKITRKLARVLFYILILFIYKLHINSLFKYTHKTLRAQAFQGLSMKCRPRFLVIFQRKNMELIPELMGY